MNNNNDDLSDQFYDPEEEKRAVQLERDFSQWDLERMEELANQYRQLEQQQIDAARAFEELDKSLAESRAAIEAEIGPFLTAVAIWMGQLVVWWEEQLVPMMTQVGDALIEWAQNSYQIIEPYLGRSEEGEEPNEDTEEDNQDL